MSGDLNFEIWISDLKHIASLQWGGRPLTFDECVQELEALFKEYCHGTFDPWCDDRPRQILSLEEKPEDRVIQVVCVLHDVSYFDFNFGFNRAYDEDLPSFYLNGHVAPRRVRPTLDALSLRLTGKHIKEN